MSQKPLNIVVFISSKKTSRLYLNVFQQYLQKKMPEANISYFISQHDNENEVVRESVYNEIKQVQERADLFLSLDGYLDEKYLSGMKGKKVLIYLPEVGIPKDKKKYIKGFDELILYDSAYGKEFETVCKKEQVKLVVKKENIWQQELRDKKNIEYARKNLELQYPQLENKKIVSVITRGQCKNHLIESMKDIPIKKLLKQLPDQVVLMTNCPQLYVAMKGIPYKYTKRCIAIPQSQILNTMMCSEWLISNFALLEEMNAHTVVFEYAGNEYEKMIMKNKRQEYVHLNMDEILRLVKDE